MVTSKYDFELPRHSRAVVSRWTLAKTLTRLHVHNVVILLAARQDHQVQVKSDEDFSRSNRKERNS